MTLVIQMMASGSLGGPQQPQQQQQQQPSPAAGSVFPGTA